MYMTADQSFVDPNLASCDRVATQTNPSGVRCVARSGVVVAVSPVQSRSAAPAQHGGAN